MAETTAEVTTKHQVDDEIEALGFVVHDNQLREQVGTIYKAGCVLLHAETGELLPERYGYAEPGDCTGDGDFPDLPASRAQVRARREALYWAKRNCRKVDVQPAHVRKIQEFVRLNCGKLGLTRDELADKLHRRHKVASLNDMTPKQADKAYWRIMRDVLVANAERTHAKMEEAHAQQ